MRVPTFLAHLERLLDRPLVSTGGRQPRRGLAVAAVAAVAAATLVTAIPVIATPPETEGLFELDKNATDDLTVSHLGSLKSQVSSTTATEIIVCERTPTLPIDPALPPAVGTVILVDAEEMEIEAVSAASNKTGGCGFTDPADTVASVRTYTVERGFNGTTAASHAGGADVSALYPGAKDGIDWDEVYAEYSANSADENPCDAIPDAVACTWLSDPPGESAFTQGSADILDIPDWHWTDMGVPDADEILHAYAVKFDGDSQFLYFGADRFAVNGAKDMGFWFFKGTVVADEATGTFLDEEGNPAEHQDGDILLLGTFTQGGAVTNIRVYRWMGDGTGSDGTLDEAGNFGDCVPGGGDNGCNTVNSTTIRSPWTYQGKGSTAAPGVVYAGGFMEGGVDLGALGLEGCFASFMAETRSSPSLTAAQKDFTLGRFESCTADVTTTPADGSGTALTDSDEEGDPGYGLPDITIGTGAAGVDVTDTATIEVDGTDTWSGTLDTFLCGPIATGTCDTGGVPVDSMSIDQSTPQPIVSASANLTSVGRYCWRGDFTSATDGVPDGSDSSEGECFEVKPVTPALTTTAWSSGDATGSAQTTPVDFGSAVYDKANLSGTAYQPGTDGGSDPGGLGNEYPSINATMTAEAAGTITFTLVGPDGLATDCTTVAAGTGTNPQDVSVTGDGDYFTSAFTPAAPGDYHWKASYSGDGPNTLGTSHNDACDESGEDVTVRTIPSTIKTQQRWFPNDTATVASTVAGDTLGAGGTVDFALYDTATCTGNVLYSERRTLTGGSASESVGTRNYPGSTGTDPLGAAVVPYAITTAYADAAGSTAGPYSWLVVYTPAATDTAHTGKQSACTAGSTESFSISYTNDPGPGTDLP